MTDHATCPHGWHVQRGEGCPEGPGCNELSRTPTGAWVEHAFLPHAKYRVVEQEHGWSVEVWDEQQPSSIPIPCRHDERCCTVHKTHSMPHVGCILR